jgi:hypothetical protein
VARKKFFDLVCCLFFFPTGFVAGVVKEVDSVLFAVVGFNGVFNFGSTLVCSGYDELELKYSFINPPNLHIDFSIL